jgi:hypothetical protein
MSDTSSAKSGLISFTPEFTAPFELYGGAGTKNDMYVLLVVVLLVVTFIFYCKCNDPLKMLFDKLYDDKDDKKEPFATGYPNYPTTRQF